MYIHIIMSWLRIMVIFVSLLIRVQCHFSLISYAHNNYLQFPVLDSFKCNENLKTFVKITWVQYFCSCFHSFTVVLHTSSTIVLFKQLFFNNYFQCIEYSSNKNLFFHTYIAVMCTVLSYLITINSTTMRNRFDNKQQYHSKQLSCRRSIWPYRISQYHLVCCGHPF